MDELIGFVIDLISDIFLEILGIWWTLAITAGLAVLLVVGHYILM